MLIANPTADSKTVFLVDEDPSTVDLYSNRLEQAGFRTVLASDAKGAFEALPNLSADLIILDLMLPKRGGFDLLEAIRSNDRLKNTPVLFLSNAYLPEMAQKALRAGGNKALPRSECTSSELVSISRGLVGVTEGGPAPAGLADQLKQDFLAEGASEVATIRQHCIRYSEVTGSVEGKESLGTVYRSVRLLSTRAGLASCRKIAQLSSAIEALLFEHLSRSNGGMSPSSNQTLNQAVECLGRLFTTRDAGACVAACKASVLLVDDDQVCNMANEVALKRANYDALSATNGSDGLNLLNDHTFDLILLDIDMPGMNGIELCQRLRRIPQHKNTPVIFVTLHGNFENQAKTLMSGGDDLISKPISPLELIVKATVFLLSNSKLQARKEPSGNRSSQSESLTVEPPGLGGSPKQVDASATLSGKFKYLREALAEETKRRETVEQQAAENAKRRAGLEAAIEENQRSQEMFRKLLEESQQQSQASEHGGAGGQLILAGRRRALEAVDRFVADKLVQLKRALAEETKRREAVEQHVAENASRRMELEAALAESQRAEDAFQRELEREENPKLLFKMESSLIESQHAREKLAVELEAARRELEALRGGQVTVESAEQSSTAEHSKLEAQIKEMQVAHADAEQQVKRLKEALTAETERREAIKRQVEEHAQCRGQLKAALVENEQTEKALQREVEASESARRWGELEAELAENKRAQAQLRQELEEAQKQLKAQWELSSGNQTFTLQARTKELQSAQVKVEQQVKRVTDALAEETRRREGAEQQAAVIGQRRAELEGELGHLRRQLDVALQQQQAQQESTRAEQVKMEARTQELQAAQAAVEQQVKRVKELQAGRSTAEERIKFLEEAFAAETKRREAAERWAAQLAERQRELEAELAQHKRVQAKLKQGLEQAQKQLEVQKEKTGAQQAQLEARTKELQAAHVDVEQRIKRVTETLAEEINRRQGAEQQSAEIGQRRRELEAELAENQQVQAKLRQELESSLQELQAQRKSSGAELCTFEARTKELQSAQAEVEQRVKRLTESLAEETKRRESAVQQAGDIGKRRSELEAQIGQLRQELKSTQHQLRTQLENSGIERAKLEVGTEELQAAQAEVEQRVRRLTETLAQESKRRESAEQQAGEIGQRRRELEVQLGQLRQQLAEAQERLQAETQLRQQLQVAQNQLVRYLQMAESQQAQAQLHQQFEDVQRQLHVQKENYLAEQAKLEAQAKQLQTAQAWVGQQVKQLTKALTVEIKHRDSAGQPAGETGQRRRELEAELAAKQLAQAQLQGQLAQAQQQLQALEENYLAERVKLETRTKELQSAEAPVGEKIKSLTEALAQETKRREVVDRLAVDAFQRRRELESNLAKHLEAERTLQRELEAPDRGKQRIELEAELAENRQAQTKLLQDLAESQQQLQAQQENYQAAPTKLEARTQELQSAQADLFGRVKRLTESLAQATKRRAEAEQHVVEIDQRREQLKVQRTENKQTEAKSQQELEASQRRLQVQQASSSPQQTKCEARIKELQSAQAEVEKQVKRLTESLAEETKRREGAEQPAGEVGQHRNQLEAELMETRQMQKNLRYELAAAQEQLQAEKEIVTTQVLLTEEAAATEKILAAPWQQGRVFLHPDQRRLVEMRANGPVRVLGSAGTGKTVVAMHRATWLARNACAQGKKILFTTFTKNLAADIAASLQKLCSREEWERIEVVNLDAWARRFLEKQGFPLKLTSEDASREKFWEKALGLTEGDLNYPPEFIRGEWDNVIQAQGIEKCDGYLTAPRVGRVRRLNREERKQLWPVFEEYRAMLTERGASEPADAFRAATRLIADRTIAFPYQAALVDEAQDFGNEAFRLIRAIVPEGENDLFIVGDVHQRTYGHQVVLSRCGIDIRGRGRKLRINYRTG